VSAIVESAEALTRLTPASCFCAKRQAELIGQRFLAQQAPSANALPHKHVGGMPNAAATPVFANLTLIYGRVHARAPSVF
jgi:hypothetical protein